MVFIISNFIMPLLILIVPKILSSMTMKSFDRYREADMKKMIIASSYYNQEEIWVWIIALYTSMLVIPNIGQMQSEFSMSFGRSGLSFQFFMIFVLMIEVNVVVILSLRNHKITIKNIDMLVEFLSKDIEMEQVQFKKSLINNKKNSEEEGDLTKSERYILYERYRRTMGKNKVIKLFIESLGCAFIFLNLCLLNNSKFIFEYLNASLR